MEKQSSIVVIFNTELKISAIKELLKKKNIKNIKEMYENTIEDFRCVFVEFASHEDAQALMAASNIHIL